MNVQDLRVIKTKNNLHDTLIHILKEKSLAEITVTELCRESDITRRTFYLHYESVAKLFEERIEHLLKDLEFSFLATAKKRRESKNESIHPKMIYIFQHVHENQDLYQIIFSSKSNFAYYEIFLEKMKKLIKQSVEQIRIQHNITDFELSYQANAILGLIIEWSRRDFIEPISYMNQTLINLLRHRGY